MKSAVPTRTIEVSAHIQIAVDKERRGSPDITHLKPHPLHTGSDLKKKTTLPILPRVHCSWQHVGSPGEGEIDFIEQKCLWFASVFSGATYVWLGITSLQCISSIMCDTWEYSELCWTSTLLGFDQRECSCSRINYAVVCPNFQKCCGD